MLQNTPFSTPVLRSFGNNISQDWYVEFSYQVPNTTTKKRIRIKSGRKFGIEGSGNSIKSKKRRLDYFTKLQLAISAKLENGWTPVQHKGTDMAKLKNENCIKALEWALQHKKRYISATTYRDYSLRLSHFISYLEREKISKRKISKLSAIDVISFLSDFDGATNANNYKRVLRSVFSVIVDCGGLKSNPAKIKDRKATVVSNKTYTTEKAREILAAAKLHYPRLHLCMLLEYYCFIRPHMEIRQLEKSDFDFEKMTVTVRGELSKNGKTRVLPLNRTIVQAIHEADYFASESKYIFGQLYKKSYFSNQFRRLKKHVEIPKYHTLYSFKHTGCAALYEATKDIYLVSKMCDHSSIATTEKYLRGLGVKFQQMESNPVPII